MYPPPAVRQEPSRNGRYPPFRREGTALQNFQLLRSVALYGLTVNFDPSDVRITTSSVAASWREIGKTDFIDFAEIHFIQKRTFRLNLCHIHFHPFHFGKVKLTLAIIEGAGIDVIADQPGSIREFQNRPDFVKSRSFRKPS
jgi:hypothetical protein